MTRNYLALIGLSLLLAVCLAARRKPEQMVCATDLYARASMQVRNLARQGRGEPPLTCAVGGGAGWLR